MKMFRMDKAMEGQYQELNKYSDKNTDHSKRNIPDFLFPGTGNQDEKENNQAHLFDP